MSTTSPSKRKPVRKPNVKKSTAPTKSTTTEFKIPSYFPFDKSKEDLEKLFFPVREYAEKTAREYAEKLGYHPSSKTLLVEFFLLNEKKPYLLPFLLKEMEQTARAFLKKHKDINLTTEDLTNYIHSQFYVELCKVS